MYNCFRFFSSIPPNATDLHLVNFLILNNYKPKYLLFLLIKIGLKKIFEHLAFLYSNFF